MKQKFWFAVFLIVIQVFPVKMIYAQRVRPVQDSIGFCWNSGEMNDLVDFLKQNSSAADENNGALIGAISVHDDYLYAGNVYYPLYKNIRTKEVVIFGVTHGSVKKEMGPLSDVLILDNYEKWKGPYQDVEISPLREIIKQELPGEYFIVSDKAHSIEHSIEALIPFLQYYNRKIKITPIMVTQMDMERLNEISGRLSEIITEYIKSNNLEPGKDIFFLISNDANHYGTDFGNSPYGLDAAAHKSATDNDKNIISRDLDGPLTNDKIERTASDLWPGNPEKPVPLWCGRYPVVFGLRTILNITEQTGLPEVSGKLLKYSDSFTEKVLPIKNTGMGITAVFSYQHWCGWFTEGFYYNHKK